MPLRPQLTVEEADRHDAVLPGRGEEALARAVAGCLVLEARLVEPRQRTCDSSLMGNRRVPFEST
jgi:hypothetical protein